MQTNNINNMNFGSVKLSSGTMGKPGAARRIVELVSGSKLKLQDRTGANTARQSAAGLRGSLPTDAVMLVTNQRGDTSLIAKTEKLEQALLAKVKKAFDPKATLVNDMN